MKNEKQWVIIDTETTHLDPQVGEIIEIALLAETGERFACKITPEHLDWASPEALEVNGYSDEAWEGALSKRQAVSHITPLLRYRLPVGHNIGFDLAHLKQLYVSADEGEEWGRFTYHSVDTMTLAYEWLIPHGLDSLSLANLCRFLDVSNDGAHTAEADVSRTSQVFRRLFRPTLRDRLFGFRLAGYQYRAQRDGGRR